MLLEDEEHGTGHRAGVHKNTPTMQIGVFRMDVDMSYFAKICIQISFVKK